MTENNLGNNQIKREHWNNQGHVLEVQQFTPEFINTIFSLAEGYKQKLKPENYYAKGGQEALIDEDLHNRVMFDLFEEESTRTRFSFERAAITFGMNYISPEIKENTIQIQKYWRKLWKKLIMTLCIWEILKNTIKLLFLSLMMRRSGHLRN